MRVKIIGSTESARVVRSYLEKAGVAVCEHLPRFALHCTIHLSEHSGPSIICDSVDSPLEQHILRHITELTKKDIILRRGTESPAIVSAANEIHLSIPAGEPELAHAVEVGVLRGVQRAHFHRPWYRRLLPLALLALAPAAHASPPPRYSIFTATESGTVHLIMPAGGLFPQFQTGGSSGGCAGATAPAHTFCGNNTGSVAAPTYSAITAADLPGTITSNTSGLAATATALASTPSLCTAGQAAIGVLASGNATGCFTPGGLANPMTTLGDIIYGASGGTPTRLPANSTATNQFLRSVSSAVPIWATPTIADIAAGTSSAAYTINAACSLNGILYVGGSCATFWGGGDIGAQINAAYAAGPSTGVHIHVSPGVYSYTTPILFQTVFKPVFLECAPGVSSNFATVTATTQLNYTPSTGTALNLGTHGSRINGCQIQGAALANSSIGVLLGGTVVGCVYCVLEHVDINQFGVGLQLGANIYVDSFYNVTIHDNGQDILYPSGTAGSGEGLRFYGGSISNKAATFSQSCISLQGNNMEISFIHTSIDQCGIVENGLNDRLDFNDPHFENPNGTTALPFIKMDTACAGCEIKTQGGRWIEDFASARTEFILDAATGTNVSNSITVIGGSYEPFQTVAQLVHSTQANCCALTFVGGATTLTSFGFTNWVNASSAGNLWYNALVTAADYIQNSEQTAPAGLANTDFLWADSTSHKWKANNNNGGAVTLSYTDFAETFSAAHSFASATLLPSAAGGTDIGSTALPFGNLWLGTAATNNYKFQPAAASGARIITIADPLSPTTVALPLTIGSGTSAMTTAGVTTGACGTTVTTAATGVLTTDSLEFTRNAAPTNANGGNLILNSWVTAGNVNFNYCNPGAATVTPTAMTLNWRVIR